MAPAPLPADDDLVRRLRERDERAFAVLVDAWSGSMLRLTAPIVGSPEAAQDVVQDTWLAVIKHLEGFQGRSSLRTWVFRILVNTARTRAARAGRELAWDLTDDDRSPTVDPERFRAEDPWRGHWTQFPSHWPDPEQRALDRDWTAELRRAVDDLPARQRLVITLRDVEGWPADEVCTALEVSEGNQRVLLHRARAAVRARLETYFDSSAPGAGRSGRERNRS